MRKMVLALTVLFSVFSLITGIVPTAHAAGVPLTSYTYQMSGKSGTIWNNGGYSATPVYSDPLDSDHYYYGTASGTLALNGNWAGLITIEGTKDGSNWSIAASKYISDFSYPKYANFSLQLNDYYKRLRVAAAYGSYNGWPGTSFTLNVNVVAFAADQATAQQAATAAQNAQSAAQQAQQAANNALNAINTITNPQLTIVSGSVQDNQGTVLQAARQARDAAQQANNKLDSINNAVTNISQSIPPVMNGIHGLNGATATSSGALQVVIDSSGATQYSYRIDNGGWSSWTPISDTVSIPVPKGVHTLTVQVANGPVGTPGPAAKSSMQVIGL